MDHAPRRAIAMAGQFYGSGSVFYLGSGETWRLRGIDDAVFERLTTQIVRHVSQGRLLRGSKRARLLVERDRYAVGSNVVVRVVAGEGGEAAAPAEITAPEASVAGFAAGVMGTTAAVDGPPLALLYQHHAGARLRATLAVAFIVGSLMSAIGLAIGGQLTGHQVVFAIAMLPAVGLGYAISRPIAKRVHSTHLRAAVLTLAAVAGVAAILRGVL
jgi:uncharacterized membrane protein YfcA